MKQAKALWHISSDKSELQTRSICEKGTEKIELAAQFSLISAGTETLVAKGRVPEDLYKVMEVPYMEGAFSFPIKYAYSLIGEVCNPDHPWYGKMVHVMHPHQDRMLVDERDLTLIPRGVSPRRACLASNLETAVNAIWDAKVSIGDKVLLVGFGLIGSLLARILQAIPGLDLWIVEQDTHRINLAKEMGFKQCQEDITDKNFDCAFNTSTNALGLQKCIDSVGMEGRIIELSWYGNQQIGINLGTSFHYQRKQIISSQVAQISNTHRTRWDYQRRKKLVFELLKNTDYDQHLSHDIAFENTPALFDRLRKGEREALAWCINY